MKNTKHFISFSDLTVKNKLVVLLFFSGILPLLITSTITYSNLKRETIASAEKEFISSINRLSNNIETIINPINQTISILYTDTELKQQLTSVYNTDIEYVRTYFQVKDKLSRIALTNGNIADIRIFTDNDSIFPNGHYISSYGNGFPFGSLSSGVHIVSLQSANGDRSIGFGQLLNYGNLNHPYGFVMVSIYESIFDSLYTNVLNSSVYIFTEDGTILSSDNKSHINENIYDIFDLDSYSANSVPFTASLDNNQFFCIRQKTVDNLNILMLSPYSSIFDNVNDTLSHVLATMFVSLLLAVLFAAYTSHYFAKCIHDLIVQIKGINIHNLSFSSENKGKDEIGQISDAVSKMSKSLENAINDVYIKELQQKDAELQLLQSQINPHLLYNSIGSITSLALKQGNTDVADFTTHLSKFYRLSLSRGNRFITIKEEVDLTNHYIQIQKVRFNDSFVFEWDIDNNLLDYITPKLLIQPFIENIINHAFKDRTVHVKISIKEADNGICYQIVDDGAGMDDTTLNSLLSPSKAKGFGISNVNQRIKLAFSEKYGVQINSTKDRGTTVIATIPKIKKEAFDGNNH